MNIVSGGCDRMAYVLPALIGFGVSVAVRHIPWFNGLPDWQLLIGTMAFIFGGFFLWNFLRYGLGPKEPPPTANAPVDSPPSPEPLSVGAAKERR